MEASKSQTIDVSWLLKGGRKALTAEVRRPYSRKSNSWALSTRTSKTELPYPFQVWPQEGALIKTIHINDLQKTFPGRLLTICEEQKPMTANDLCFLRLTGRFSFCCSAAFFFHSRSRSSLIRLSMEATSRLRLFRFSRCCCNLEFWSWLSLFLSWTKSKEPTQHKCQRCSYCQLAAVEALQLQHTWSSL